MMDVARTLQHLELAEDTMVSLSCEDHGEVFHYMDDYREDVLANTDIVRQVAELLANFGEQVYSYGSSLLGQLREGGYLEEYERDETFADYLEEILNEHYHEIECFEFTTTKYDHKRGRCTIEASVELPIHSLLAQPRAFDGWKASVRTPHGVLMIG